VTLRIERTLLSITDLIVRSCDPEAVVLFGSYAKGTAGRDSDIDLLVIGDFRTSRWLRTRELEGMLSQFALRIDIHMLTPQELEVERTRSYSFLNSTQARRTLYGRKGVA
jgi:predicted nucleotidyltransferase